MQEINRSLILRLLGKMQICSRADLAHQSGLKQATISYIIKELIEQGVVRETGLIYGKKGRRSIGLELDSKNLNIVAARLSRKYYSVALFDVSGKEKRIKTRSIEPSTAPETVIHGIKDEISDIL